MAEEQIGIRPDSNNNNQLEEDEFDTDAPAFIDLNSKDVEEVILDDTEPMDEDDVNGDDVNGENVDMDQDMADKKIIPDQSFCCISSHSDSVYAVSMDITQPNTIQVASGGGDDNAFLTSLTVTDIMMTAEAIPQESLNLSQATSTPHKDSVSSVAFNSDTLNPQNNHKMLAIGCYDGTIQIWNVHNSSTSTSTSSANVQEQYQLHSTLEGPTDIEWLSWHPKGGTVLLAGSTDGTVWMYHALTSKCLQVFVGHEGDVTCGRFTLDGKFAVTAGMDGTLRIWAPRTGLSRHVFRLDSGSSSSESNNPYGEGGAGAVAAVTCMDCRAVQNSNGSSGSLILCGSENGVAYICHVGTKKVLTKLRHAEEDATKNNHQPAPMEDHDDNEEEDQFEKDLRSVEAVGFYNGPNHNDLYNWCATAGVNGLLKVWDLGNNGQCRQTCVHTSEATEETAGITRLKWHPTLPLIFTATTDGIIRLWDARTGQCLITLTGGHSDIINDLDVYFDTNDKDVIVAAGSDDGKIRLFRVDVPSALNAS